MYKYFQYEYIYQGYPDVRIDSKKDILRKLNEAKSEYETRIEELEYYEELALQLRTGENFKRDFEIAEEKYKRELQRIAFNIGEKLKTDKEFLLELIRREKMFINFRRVIYHFEGDLDFYKRAASIIGDETFTEEVEQMEERYKKNKFESEDIIETDEESELNTTELKGVAKIIKKVKDIYNEKRSKTK